MPVIFEQVKQWSEEVMAMRMNMKVRMKVRIIHQ